MTAEKALHPLVMITEKSYGATTPPLLSSAATCAFLVGCLYVFEFIGKKVIWELKVRAQ